MKIRIIKWYKNGDILEVNREDDELYYFGTGINTTQILKSSAEVVEEIKKDCTTCKFDPNGCNLMGVECDNFSKWQPEKSEKSCDNCHYDKFNTSEETSCQRHVGICEYYEKWQQIEPTISKTETVGLQYKTCTNCLYGVDKPKKCGNCHPVNKDQWKSILSLHEKYPVAKNKQLINLIKLTGKNGFTYYINVDKINSITPTEYGVSISTSDRDGDYLVVDSIDDVLGLLGYGGK